MPSEKTKHPVVRREGSYPPGAILESQRWSKEVPGSQFRGFLTHRVEQGGEWRKGMRTQTLLSGSAVALHYQSGPLEVSAAPHSLLPKSEQFSNTHGSRSPQGNVEARWCAARGLKTRGVGAGEI